LIVHSSALVVCMQLKLDHVFANPAEKRSSRNT
jgi:hypothetical protein